MKTGEAAKRLKVDRKTISNWIDDYGLEEVFSPGARGLDGNIQRNLNQADLVALNTIRKLRSENVSWAEIKERLKRGEWETEFPSSVTDADHFMISIEQRQAEYTIEMVRERDAALAQRDAALAQVEQLEEEVERIKEADIAKQRRIDQLIAEAKEADVAKQKRIEELLREMGELRDKISAEKDGLNASLMRELGNLQREIGKLEGKLELYEEKESREAKENPRDNL